MRWAEGKEFALWLCHSGNAVTFAAETADLYENGVESLSDATKKDSETREKPERIKTEMFCGECSMQMEPRSECCAYCGWQRPRPGEIRVVQGELIDLDMRSAAIFKPREGLRAPCLKEPRRVWNAALAYSFAGCRKGEDAARKWAFGIWRGVYPNAKLPYGLYDAACNADAVQVEEWQLIDREVKRFRRTGTKKRRAA